VVAAPKELPPLSTDKGKRIKDETGKRVSPFKTFAGSLSVWPGSDKEFFGGVFFE
jgi:hypothetical protein